MPSLLPLNFYLVGLWARFCRGYTAVCLLFLLCSLGTPAFAEQSLLPQLKFKHIEQNALEALSHINDIAQDTDGYMWFAAAKGIARYDGYALRVFGHEAGSDGLPNPWVRKLAVTGDGHLWILNRSGVCRYNKALVSFDCFGAMTNDVSRDIDTRVAYYDLFLDNTDQLWVSSDLGLSKVNRSAMSLEPLVIADRPMLGDDEGWVIETISQGPEGNLWLGHRSRGITVISPALAVLDALNVENGRSTSNNIRALFWDNENRLWIGSQYGGVAILGAGQKSAMVFAHDFKEQADTVWDINQDKRGLIWIGDGTGVHLVDPDDMSVESHRYVEGVAETPGNFVVRSIFEDSEGGMWLGFFPSGIDRVDESASQFITYRHDPSQPNSLPDGGVLATLPAQDGQLWVGAGFGLALFDREQESFTHFPYKPDRTTSPSGSTVLDMAYGTESEIWLGLWSRGLNRFNPKTGQFTHYLPEVGNSNSLLGREPWGVLYDSQHNLWVASEKGVSRYRPETDDFQRYLPLDEDGKQVESLYTRSIYEDKRKNLWVASFSGLLLLDQATGQFMRRYTSDLNDHQTISSNAILCLFEDSANRLWIGTDGGGLNLFDRDTGKFTRFDRSSGLPDLSITSIQEDKEGFLWLSSYQGLIKFDPEQGNIRHFTSNQGLPGNLFNRDSGSQLATGEFAFGSTQGLVIFNPAQLKSSPPNVDVVFSKLRVMNQYIDIGDASGLLDKEINLVDQIQLTHQQNVFSVEFAGLEFSVPQETQYAYRLMGFEERWQYVGKSRAATYTNLDAGDYTLEVKAAIGDTWSDSVSQLNIKVLPPLWLTWWAKLLYVIFVLGILCRIYAIQVARLIAARKRLEQERELVNKLREVEKLKDSINKELDEQVKARTQELQSEKERLQAAHEQLALLNNRLRAIAVADQLTGLSNRHFLDNTLPDDIALILRDYKKGHYDRSLAFILFDIDNFKQVNDTYGHQAGDSVLVQISRLLKKIVRQADYVVRWGGEEFIIIMRQVEPLAIEQFVERLRAIVQSTPFIINTKIKIEKTISIGFASYPFSCYNPEALKWDQVVGIADRALYTAKHSGKNQWVGVMTKGNLLNKERLQSMIKKDKFIEAVDNGDLDVTTSNKKALTWQ